ncbi:MAG TPA: response regulator [Terriglobales bacterium]|nr:response regulator [Terriglobales bacterium]
MKEKGRDWRTLAAQVSVENDPIKLRDLVRQLNRALDESERNFYRDVGAAESPVLEPVVHHGSKRLLFVDDEQSIRLTLPPILESNGFQVWVASTVSEAIAEIQQREFDVLLSDLNIGSEGNGFQVVAAMRQAYPRCVTILLTGYPGFETAVEGIRQQVDDYVVKPADISLLVKLIHEKLEMRRNSPA